MRMARYRIRGNSPLTSCGRGRPNLAPHVARSRRSRPANDFVTPEQKASLAGLVSVDPGIMHGTPCFTGTRVPVQTIEDGDTLDSFLRDFPSRVTREQAIQFLELAKAQLI